MADFRQGAKMQSYNNEIVKCLDDLCERRNRLVKEIQREEQEKNVLESQFRALQNHGYRKGNLDDFGLVTTNFATLNYHEGA